jgi:hypothetical protein
MSPQIAFAGQLAPGDELGLGKINRRCHRLGDDFVGLLLPSHFTLTRWNSLDADLKAGVLYSLSQTVETYPEFETNCLAALTESKEKPTTSRSQLVQQPTSRSSPTGSRSRFSFEILLLKSPTTYRCGHLCPPRILQGRSFLTLP